MKRASVILALLGCLALVAGCEAEKRPEALEKASNPEFRVEKLFTMENGCEAYKFHDEYYPRYFVVCPNSKVDMNWREQHGKHGTNTGSSSISL